MEDTLHTWVKKTRHLHATVESISNMRTGESRTFLCLGTKKTRTSCAPPTGSKTYASMVFKDDCVCIRFTKTSGSVCGRIRVVGEHEDKMGGLHLEYTENKWHALTAKGRMPLKDSNNRRMLPGHARLYGIARFAVDTRLGWYGPMIAIEDVDKMPICTPPCPIVANKRRKVDIVECSDSSSDSSSSSSDSSSSSSDSESTIDGESSDEEGSVEVKVRRNPARKHGDIDELD